MHTVKEIKKNQKNLQYLITKDKRGKDRTTAILSLKLPA